MKRIMVSIFALLLLVGSAAFASVPAGDALVLEGTASEVGKMWGEVNKDSIVKAFNAFLARAEGKEEQLRSFAKLSIVLSQKINCSYW
ncbi:MAG TPA: hypothetical protein PLD93_04185, partial [Synergistaceae bacterium]|nr:hypothetical protein [Synergistaceae bacterium]